MAEILGKPKMFWRTGYRKLICSSVVYNLEQNLMGRPLFLQPPVQGKLDTESCVLKRTCSACFYMVKGHKALCLQRHQ